VKIKYKNEGKRKRRNEIRKEGKEE